MKPIRAAVFCSLVSLNFTAQADDSLEVVTVSATPIPLENTSSAISVIGRDEIQRRGAATLQGLLREVPGLAVSQQGSLGAVTQVRVRGAEANQVLVLINGIEANDLAQGSEFDFSQISTRDIERIEIVRGPQSALWGSDAIAGVINIITLPGNSETGVELALEGGSFSTRQAGITATIAGERQQTRLTLDYLDTDGTNISRTGSEDDGLENLTVGLAGTWDIDDSISTSYTLRYTDKTTDFDGTDFVATGLPTDANNRTESTYLYAGVNIQHDISNAVSQQFSLQYTDSDNGTFSGGAQPDQTAGEKIAARYQVNLAMTDHLISARLEHETEDFSQRGTASFFGDPNQDRSNSAFSLATEYRYTGDQVNFSLSARQDQNDEFDDAFSWRATGNYQLADTTLYASLGRSVKNPTFTERFGFYTNFIGNPGLEPEQSDSVELGVRHRMLDNRLSIDVAWYRADLDNEINGFVFDATTGGFTAQNVAGESDREGVELAIDYEVSDSLSLRGGYTYLDATEPDATGNDLTEVRRPENTGYLGAALTYSNWGADLTWHYTGDQDDNYFPPFPPFQERVVLPAFSLLGISGYYDLTANTRMTLRLENATDKSYEQVFGYQSPGFGGYAGLRVTF